MVNCHDYRLEDLTRAESVGAFGFSCKYLEDWERHMQKYLDLVKRDVQDEVGLGKGLAFVTGDAAGGAALTVRYMLLKKESGADMEQAALQFFDKYVRGHPEIYKAVGFGIAVSGMFSEEQIKKMVEYVQENKILEVIGD